jgi:hypothetical protein
MSGHTSSNPTYSVPPEALCLEVLAAAPLQITRGRADGCVALGPDSHWDGTLAPLKLARSATIAASGKVKVTTETYSLLTRSQKLTGR